MNQLVSFLLKQVKSQGLVKRILGRGCPPSASLRRYYHYLRLIKEKLPHYLNE